ncbi:hemin receptor [Filimonas lacunae]|nr:hemin receptor [Filimonas lacunae]
MTCVSGQAQTPDDALRSSWFIPRGSARSMAIGGAMGSLGGDISAASVNPAGIGLYKTKEIVFTPGFVFNSVKSNFRDSTTKSSKTGFAYGPIGFVLGNPEGRRNGWTSSAFALTVTQLASYNNQVSYAGYNNYSSFSEQYVEELAGDNADSYAAENNYINGSSLAFRTYLVDTLNNSSGAQIGYKTLVPFASGIYQQYNAVTRGGFHEINLAFAGNKSDRFYIGGSLGIPIVSYHRELFYQETDATGNTNNDFNSFQYREKFTSSGIGLNAKLGVIYKPTDYFRLGFAFHTPSLISFKDQLRASITTDLENYTGYRVFTETSDNLNSGKAVERNYNQLTPYRFIVSGSYVFREAANTRRQRAFITADIEYINHRGSRYSTSEDDNPGLKAYYKAVNEATKGYLKNAFNFRVGGEIKFAPWMIRLGAAYYGSPYQDKKLKANRMMTSGGIGYRNRGIFIDVTYAYMFNKDVDFPYRLNDAANTFSSLNNNRGNLIMTIGFKI